MSAAAHGANHGDAREEPTPGMVSQRGVATGPVGSGWCCSPRITKSSDRVPGAGGGGNAPAGTGSMEVARKMYASEPTTEHTRYGVVNSNVVAMTAERYNSGWCIGDQHSTGSVPGHPRAPPQHAPMRSATPTVIAVRSMRALPTRRLLRRFGGDPRARSPVPVRATAGGVGGVVVGVSVCVGGCPCRLTPHEELLVAVHHAAQRGSNDVVARAPENSA